MVTFTRATAAAFDFFAAKLSKDGHANAQILYQILYSTTIPRLIRMLSRHFPSTKTARFLVEHSHDHVVHYVDRLATKWLIACPKSARVHPGRRPIEVTSALVIAGLLSTAVPLLVKLHRIWRARASRMRRWMELQ